jgi:predicted ABC-type sugar transport system permease subunit
MADIRIQQKKGPPIWIWIVLVLAIVVIAWFVLTRTNVGQDVPQPTQPAQPTGSLSAPPPLARIA